ncbi:pentatricopeptide repeat-containing protein At4g30700 isoform X2 [Cryptomeria japonica]|uniref:pentatricopeptide repeat-containing protein At4g30700 isoform X2 n=1 Tax=Cryptomeria japonica TaxID=3369 RepID=UPI0025AD347B|nr:pentatricopeptide repeat-containing protein At4g30700 isoform X2 [Cryptomeria japonica]
MPSTAHIRGLCREGRLKDALHILFTANNTCVESSAYLHLLQACIDKKALAEAYRKHGFPQEAFTLFYQMQRTAVQPDHFTFSAILPVCSSVASLKYGLQIHGRILRCGFQSNVVVMSTLMDMYSKCGSMDNAREVFVKMPQRDVVAWNAIIAGYEQHGLVENALMTFKKMQLTGIEPNSATFASVLPVCAKMGDLKLTMEIHQIIIKSGFLRDAVVVTSLIDTYAKCGNIQEAHRLFDDMPERDMVSWTAIIAGHVHIGLVDKALDIFKQMQSAGVKPDTSTFASILPACAKLGALEQGTEIHRKVLESGFLSDIIVTALVDMYAKCGSIEKAFDLFEKIHHPNVISWNTIIAGHAMHGYSKDALSLLEQMKQSSSKLDHVSFVCVLFACSHAGLVEDGCKYFSQMSNSYCIMPTVDHYVCMVDLLGRAGYLEETLNFIIKMPITPGLVVWKCLLGVCRLHKNICLGVFVSRLLFEMDPKNAEAYVLISNIYAEAGMWGDAQNVRKLMKERGIIKKPGSSWIEVDKMIHAFCVGDKSHPQTEEIYAMLEKLSLEMKAAGYIPDTRSVLNDLEKEEKELLICHHSEKLAIAFGLLNTAPGTTIRVVKNLRVCVDCHTTTKFISKIVAREIVVRDANRFHHFKNGQCSCGDYW